MTFDEWTLGALIAAVTFVGPACASSGECPCPETEAAVAKQPSQSEQAGKTEADDRMRRPVPALDAALWMQSSAEYEANVRQAYAAARGQLDEALETPEWTASIEQEEAGNYREKPPAVVVDVDETMLDNSAYEARLLNRGETFDIETWNAWCREVQAPPVPGAVEFAKAAAERDITVFYVTNRQHAVEEATRKNLQKHGFPVSEERDVILTKNEREGWGSDKTPRRELIAEDFRILLLVGDNLGDFVGGTEVAPAERSAMVETYGDRWGRKWIALPNPTYGDWESGTFDHDHGLERRKKLRRKLDALETLETDSTGETKGD